MVKRPFEVIPEKMMREKANNRRLLNNFRRRKKWNQDLNHPVHPNIEKLILCYQTAELLILELIDEAKEKKKNGLASVPKND